MQRQIAIYSGSGNIPRVTIAPIGSRKPWFYPENTGAYALAKILKVLPAAIRKFSETPPPAILRPLWGEIEIGRDRSAEIKTAQEELDDLRRASLDDPDDG